MEMNGPAREAEGLARRILACEEDARDSPQAHAASRAIEKLRLHLTKFVGTAGFQTLLARSLSLAKAQVDWLGPIQVTTDGALTGLQEAAQTRDVNEARKGETALLTQLLALLITFIGEPITLRMVRDIWPHARWDDQSYDPEEKAHEQTR